MTRIFEPQTKTNSFWSRLKKALVHGCLKWIVVCQLRGACLQYLPCYVCPHPDVTIIKMIAECIVGKGDMTLSDVSKSLWILFLFVLISWDDKIRAKFFFIFITDRKYVLAFWQIWPAVMMCVSKWWEIKILCKCFQEMN